ncbi:response regulator [Mucilaginibacter myungsuensis]|uniref:Response regulator n=1 Tax=Mucilaginibacter myungsuensis TaxID=649104 RepID=A0A929L3Q8_9SPHI|nr:response regulator [Mucilaginibacter myungsuensis]MBE9663480.1 response regulator [Mucilaginibacter myungsuensis]MDN3600218.1 response regulator [Mucilaginibacter myungsuensis]
MAKKILIIEDDRDIRETITYALEDAGYEVVSSEDAGILKSLDKLKPSLILLDNWLTDWKSDANGQQLCKELKTDPKTSHIPVVIVSAVSNIREIAEAGQADGYLKKPFDLIDLNAVVEKYAL